jgi:hypothetical protein
MDEESLGAEVFKDVKAAGKRFVGCAGQAPNRLLKNAFGGSWSLAGAEARSASKALTPALKRRSSTGKLSSWPFPATC